MLPFVGFTSPPHLFLSFCVPDSCYRVSPVLSCFSAGEKNGTQCFPTVVRFMRLTSSPPSPPPSSRSIEDEIVPQRMHKAIAFARQCAHTAPALATVAIACIDLYAVTRDNPGRLCGSWCLKHYSGGWLRCTRITIRLRPDTRYDCSIWSVVVVAAPVIFFPFCNEVTVVQSLFTGTIAQFLAEVAAQTKLD